MSEEQKESLWRSWWRQLQTDRGGRAELRRCGNVAEAAFVEPYHLLRRMKGNPEGELDLQRLALIAAALAHVEEDHAQGGSLAAAMASPAGEKPIVSDSRFRQMLRTEEREFDDRLRELVRALRQLKGQANVDKLATDLWWWNEKTRRRWALDYYERAAPEKKSKDS